MTSQEYKDYLLSPHWLSTRDQKRKECGYQCERCGERSNLHVHHLTYFRLWCEEMSDLQLLCKECHYSKHPEKEESIDEHSWANIGRKMLTM